MSESRHAKVLWVDLTLEARTPLLEHRDAGFALNLQCVNDPAQIPNAIGIFSPQLICFDFDQLELAGTNALARTRREHPNLPVLLIIGGLSESIARWALQMRVRDLLVKPLPVQALCQHIAALVELTSPKNDLAAPILNKRDRTLPAITHVAAQFQHKIALEKVAGLCSLSPSQFCRIFKQRQGVSFLQYLLHYRIVQACERLCCPGALAKEVAYSVGFNDLSYFSWAFKRQVGVCPSQYHLSPKDQNR